MIPYLAGLSIKCQKTKFALVSFPVNVMYGRDRLYLTATDIKNSCRSSAFTDTNCEAFKFYTFYLSARIAFRKAREHFSIAAADTAELLTPGR